MTIKTGNSFGTRKNLKVTSSDYAYFCLGELVKQGWSQVERFPVSIKILLENVLRRENGYVVTAGTIETLLSYPASQDKTEEIPFMPARVLLQDFTGVPAIVDLATMRHTLKRLGNDPNRINPLVRADLVIDHSVQVDEYGTCDAFQHNVSKEYERNRERYSLLRWAQNAFRNFTVIPPGKGIVHQVNLEYLATVVQESSVEGVRTVYPDTLVGTDSHTTMINGLGVVGWGVGGIEAEAVMLGQPYYLPVPKVVGVRLEGELSENVTATDLVLTVTQKLRAKGVVGKFVEFYGPGLAALSVPDRATLANMAPEYGATMGFCPVDDQTLNYLRLTGREEALIRLVEAYTKEQGLYGSLRDEETLFSDTFTVDLSTVEPSFAGPKRPQDRISIANAAASFKEALEKPVSLGGFGVSRKEEQREVLVLSREKKYKLTHGSLVVAALTSCTNMSNPALMIAAGLLAQKALERGIRSKPWVKTSFAPGSRIVTDYLKESGLLTALEEQGFYLVGYGCTTCIGNSGPLREPIQRAIEEGNLVTVAVLSGNRNFEGRIHEAVRANYLASPPLVVACALAGDFTIDFEKEPLDLDDYGRPVFLKDIWPSSEEVAEIVNKYPNRKQFLKSYGDIYTGGAFWQDVAIPEGDIYEWDPHSSYVRQPPFLDELTPNISPVKNITGARVLMLLGDSVTTDHISPAGSIPPKSPAGQYLQSLGIDPSDFNSYGARRGNHEVMIRGTFANVRIQNRLLSGVTGGYTRHFPDGKPMSVWEAAGLYRQENVPLIVIAGKEYGTGSSRDWAAKGTALLGVKAVLAESFERIHRSNLLGMGILPLQFLNEDSAYSLGLSGEEIYSFRGLSEGMEPGQEIEAEAVAPDGRRIRFSVLSRLDTMIEVEYYRHGGILPKVLREILNRESS